MFDKTQYVIEQKLVALRDTYGVKDTNGNLLGYVKGQASLSVGPLERTKYWFEGTDGTRQGEIRRKALGETYEVYDAKNQLHATIKLGGTSRFVFGTPEWRMEDPEGKQLARGKGDLMGHNYQILAPDGSVIAQIHRKWATIRDSYCIDISRQDFDPLLVLSYAVVMDHAEHKGNGPFEGFRIGPGP